ncbi:MAG: hypothetical protein OXD54_13200 [Candidatus Poribacteria bacterium]|nr:hypothetical protein [Candidatus Poribacteria bacterium]
MEGFGLGLAVGMGSGLAIGIGSSGTNRKKLEKQLRNALVDKEISISNKDGEPLTVDKLFEILDQKYKKV